jgi:hypothetical protein
MIAPNSSKLLTGFVLIAAILMAVYPAVAQEGTAEETAPLDAEAMEEAFVTTFNRILREEVGTRALARNAILDEVAQKITDAVGCSDQRVEFDIVREVLEAGYQAYPGDTTARTTRIPLLPIVNFRPIEEMAQFYTVDIFETINQDGRYYREIGVGITLCTVNLGDEAMGSTQQYALFVILGSQPDVIPVVIENDGKQLTVDGVPVTVNLSIHQENSRQREGIFGRTVTMRLSEAPLDESVQAIPYSSTLEWEFKECGANTVYYELTDANGLTVTGETSVEVVCSE